MHVLVPTQAAGVLEGFGTSVTWIRAFASVLAEVILVVRAPLEGERTVGTLEGTQTCMHTAMDLNLKIKFTESKQ